MNNKGTPDGPLFFPFHFTQQIHVHVTISRKIYFMQRIVHLFGPDVLGEVLRTPNPVILPLILYENSSVREIVGPFTPSAHQTIHIFVSTKIRFQATLKRIFGEQRLAAINASVNPFVLPLVCYRHSLDVFIFVLL